MVAAALFLATVSLDDPVIPDLAEDFMSSTYGFGTSIESQPRPYDGPSVLNPDVRFQGSERLTLRVNFEFVPVPDGPLSGKTIAETVCLNACQGPPPDHATHRECDRLCDRPCDRDHTISVANGPLEQDQMGINELGKSVRDLVKASNNRGMPMVMDDFAVLDAIAVPFDFLRKNNQPVTWNPGHLNPEGVYQPCHQTTLRYKSLQYDVRATVEVRFMLFRGSAEAPEYAEYKNFVTRGPFTVGRVRGINPNPTGTGATICACEKTGDIGQWRDPILKVGDDYVVLPTDAHKNRNSVTALFRKHDAQITVAGQNLNYGTLEATGSSEMEVNFPAGTFLQCLDDATQNGMIVDTVRTTFAFQANKNPFLAAPTRFRFACLNMNKKEPTPSTRFVPMPARDSRLVLLAQEIQESRFRGPWDQARVWLYTDEPTYAKLGGVLLPNVSKATYLQCLREVADYAPRRRNGSEWGTLITPDILFDANGDERALQWGARQIPENRLAEFLKFAKEGSLPDEFDEGSVRTYRALIAEFGMRKAPAAQELAKVVAERWVPAVARSEFAKQNGFDGLLWMALQAETSNGKWARTFLNAHAPEIGTVAEEVLAETQRVRN